jgi:membrane protein DedA with SNARE-associated domain
LPLATSTLLRDGRRSRYPRRVLPWLERYSVIILPALAVAEQLGIPLPAVPALLATGALGATGRVNLWLVIGAIVVGTLPVDLVWHELGRRRGARVLSGLCRLTLEPDVCVRRTENLFLRFGVWTMLIAKFLPGLTTVLPPMAGAFGIPRLRFALFDVAGTVLWAGLWSGVGYLFSDAIEPIIVRVSALGHDAIAVVAAALIGYVALKYLRRWLFLRRLRIARISPDILRRMIEAGEDVTIIDLRTALDVAAVPYAIPGSRWIPAEQLDAHLSEIPRDRDLVLYCS